MKISGCNTCSVRGGTLATIKGEKWQQAYVNENKMRMKTPAVTAPWGVKDVACGYGGGRAETLNHRHSVESMGSFLRVKFYKASNTKLLDYYQSLLFV